MPAGRPWAPAMETAPRRRRSAGQGVEAGASCADNQLPNGGFGPAGLEPVDALADQIEAQRVAAGLFRHRYVDRHVSLVAARDRVRQEGPGPVTLDRRPVLPGQLRAEAHVAAAVRRRGGKGTL